MTLLQLKPMRINKLTLVEDPKSKRHSLEGLRDEFFVRMEGKAEVTLKEYSRSIGRLYDFMRIRGLTAIQDLREENIRSFQEYLYQEVYSSPVTVHYYLKTLSRYSNFLISYGLLDKNPFHQAIRIPKPETAGKVKRYYSHQESMRRYRNYLKKTYNYMISLTYFEALRGFISFLEGKRVRSVCSVSYETIQEYVDYLWNYRNDHGRIYSVRTIEKKLCDLKIFFRTFYREGLISENPTKGLNVSKFASENLPDQRIRVIQSDKSETEFDQLFIKFRDYIETKGHAEGTVRSYRFHLGIFFDWLGKRKVTKATDVNKSMMLEYYRELHHYKGVKGKGWSNSTRFDHLVCVKKFFQHLFQHEYIKADPVALIDLPKKGTGLPMTCLSDDEARKILGSVGSARHGYPLRDKAILELLYSSALRASELTHLAVDDMDFNNNYVRVRHAKGGKAFERVVPFGRLANKALKEYLIQERPNLVRNDTKILFLTHSGRQMSTSCLHNIVKNCVIGAGIKTRISTHSWRVGCATELLKNGVDIRYVQEHLGHRSLESTKQYVRLIPKDLKKMHTQFHPREKYYRQLQGSKG